MRGAPLTRAAPAAFARPPTRTGGKRGGLGTDLLCSAHVVRGKEAHIVRGKEFRRVVEGSGGYAFILPALR